MTPTWDTETTDLAETETLGRRLGTLLFPGAVVALIGPLGAGKTNFVRAVALGLDVADARLVTSPTFVLIQEYQARLPIYHFDVYRLATKAAFIELGPHEYFEGEGVCLVEWADKVADCLPDEHLEVNIASTGETCRRFSFFGRGRKYEEVVGELCGAG